MTVDIHSEEGQMIRQLIPLSTLPINQFEDLCNKITIEDTRAGTYLFKKNDATNVLIYLIDGSVTLQSNKLKVETIESGTESSRFALAHQIPRKIDAYTNTSVRFLRLNIDMINALLSISHEEENSVMFTDESEEENNDDWMTTLLKSPIFKALPPANLQQIIMGLEEVAFEKDDVIVNQGDPGDYYYLIKQGHCLLSRKPAPNAKEIKLAQLRSQDTFGEDSLLSGEPRNVSITALSNVTLLKLSKKKFISLIKEPALQYITHSKIKEELGNGAILLDVRTPDEYTEHHLPDSINAPFFSLRMQLKTFDKKKPVIVVCANGNTSEAAAFLLLRHKFKALIVSGGMEQDSEDITESQAELEIDEGNETSGENSNKDIEPENAFEALAETLQLENQQLKQAIKELTAGKEELEKKYGILFKQTEKLKAVLDSLTIGGALL